MVQDAISPEQLDENIRLLNTEPREGPAKQEYTPEEVFQRLTKPFDPGVYKRKGNFPYVPQAVVRRRVNNATRGRYSWVITHEEFREATEIQGSANNIVHKIRGVLSI